MQVLINDKINDFDLEEVLPLLSEERREKTLRYRHESGRRQCAAAWLLLRDACRRYCALDDVPPMDFGEHGKPFFPSMPQLHFNLSHCAEAVACVIDDAPVGIDIEKVRHASDTLLNHIFSDEEIAEVKNSANPDLMFTCLWTKKESLLKMTGEGLTSDLKTLLSERKDVELQTVVAPSEKYVYTVACQKKG